MAERATADLANAHPSSVQAALGRLVGWLADSPRLRSPELAALREEGVAGARAGVPLPALTDLYLTIGWALWEEAGEQVRGADDPAAVRELGAALLRAGDDIAAALAEGYTAEERDIAIRTGGSRRAAMDDLLQRSAGPGFSRGRLGRAAILLGLDAADVETVVVVASEDPFGDDDPRLDGLERAISRRPGQRLGVAGIRDGELILLIPRGSRASFVPELLETTLRGPDWWAVAERVADLHEISGAYATAREAVTLAMRVVERGTVTPAADLAVELALAADAERLRIAVDRWLGPLRQAPRGSALTETLEAWFAAGQSITGAARMLEVGARTVSYRLVRIAGLLGVERLDAPTRSRLATALLGERLLRQPPSIADRGR